MWLASILIINTLTMLTIAHADRGRPTLKNDERFRNRMDNFQTHSHSLLCWSLTLPILMFFGLGWSLSVPLISSLKNVSNFLRLSPTTVPATPHTKENRKRPWIQLEIYKIGLTSVTKTEQKRTTLLLYCCLVPVITLIILAELVFSSWRTLIGCWEGREKGVLPSRALWEGNTLFSGPVRFGGEISKLI